MNNLYDPELVSVMLHQISAGRAVIYRKKPYDFLLAGAKYVSPVMISIDEETARLTAGSGIIVNIGLDSPGKMDPLREVVEAIFSGNASEYFGINETGSLGYIGWKIWYPAGNRTSGNITGKNYPLFTHQLAPWPAINSQE